MMMLLGGMKKDNFLTKEVDLPPGISIFFITKSKRKKLRQWLHLVLVFERGHLILEPPQGGRIFVNDSLSLSVEVHPGGVNF